jgi:molybdopterin-binding protein
MPEISARNVFKGKVVQIKNGVVNSEITIAIKGGLEMVSLISKSSVERMKLKEGMEVVAIVRASNILIGTGF